MQLLRGEGHFDLEVVTDEVHLPVLFRRHRTNTVHRSAGLRALHPLC